MMLVLLECCSCTNTESSAIICPSSSTAAHTRTAHTHPPNQNGRTGPSGAVRPCVLPLPHKHTSTQSISNSPIHPSQLLRVALSVSCRCVGVLMTRPTCDWERTHTSRVAPAFASITRPECYARVRQHVCLHKCLGVDIHLDYRRNGNMNQFNNFRWQQTPNRKQFNL